MNATAAPVLVILSLHSSLISATAIFWPRHGASVSEKTSGGYRWGLLAASAKSKGKPSSIIDGLLAADGDPPQSDNRFAKRRRLHEHKSAGGESVGTMTIRQAQRNWRQSAAKCFFSGL